MASEIPEDKRYELEKISEKSTLVAVLLGIFLSPLAYVYLGKHLVAIINLLTANWFLTGFVTVPIHAWKIIRDAEKELAQADLDGDAVEESPAE